MSDIVKQYFDAFSQKNLDMLSELYNDNVVSWEWGEKIHMGKSEVLSSNKELFDDFKQITVLLKSRADTPDKKHFCEVVMVLDNHAVSFVNVFVIINDKIVSIATYRGF